MPTIRELVEEAEENFGTGRHGNSAALFKRAALETFEKGVIPDGVYLSYRALYDLQKTKQTQDMIILLQRMVQSLTTNLIRLSSSLIEQGQLDDHQEIDILGMQEKAMYALQMEEERQSILAVLLQRLQQQYQESHDKQYLVKYLDKQNDEMVLGQLLEHMYEEASHEAEHGQFDGDLVAAAMIGQYLQYVPEDLRTGNTTLGPCIQKLKELLQKISKGDYYGSSRSKEVVDLLRRYNQGWIVGESSDS